MVVDVRIDNLSKIFTTRKGSTPAVQDTSFQISTGEMLVLLGPSGCGKTTTLRCVAGLEEPNYGRVSFGDTVVFDHEKHTSVPTHRRDIGLVFQTFALWPHLSARQNIEFPLKARRIRGNARSAPVDDVAKLVDLDEALLDKRPGLLSGGQQQRVGLARALVGRPGVMLFDEPLGSLDALLREQLRRDLQELHRHVGFTGIYVTHDFTEALALGDQIAVMGAGQVQQVGSPEHVFAYPETIDVARLIGYRLLTTLKQDHYGWIAVAASLPDLHFQQASGTVDVFARPEEIELSGDETQDRDPASTHLRLNGEVTEITYLSGQVEVTIWVGDRHIQAATGPTGRRWAVGDRVVATVARAQTRFYDSDGYSCMPTNPDTGGAGAGGQGPQAVAHF